MLVTIGKEIEYTGYGYRYKDILPVSLLGLVGFTYAGYRVQQMNAIIEISKMRLLEMHFSISQKASKYLKR